MTMQRFSIGGVTYRQQMRRCGRPTCKRCPHGPYWYVEWWRNGKVVTDYVGKNLPPTVKPPTSAAPAPQPSPAMTPRQALAILGIGLDWSYLKGQKRWQLLQKEYAKQGDEGRFKLVEVNEAWALVCDSLV